MNGVRLALGFVLTLGFSLTGQTLLRIGASRASLGGTLSADELFRHHFVALLLSPYVLGGFVLSGVGAVSWLYVLAQYDLGRALPLLGGLAYLALFVVGRFWLGERTGLIQLAGLVLLVLGMYLLGYKKA